MAGPALTNDLVTRSLSALTAKEIAVGRVLLEDAWGVILSARPSAAARISTDPAFSALVVQVQVAMVLRVLANPSGVLEESGDNYSYRRDSAVSTGALYLSEAEEALLSPAATDSSNAFSIKTTGSGPRYSEPW